jgi:CubicO group peptidase (beta-lactamase class C family)
MELHGSCDPAFRRVADTFASHFARHPSGGPVELGAAVCVEVDGRRVVDLWAGFADPDRTRPWGEDTMVCVFSCTKGIAAICLHQLAERGLIDIDAPVARYWPEFAAAGKQDVTVRHVLTHAAGLNRLRDPLPPGGLYDWRTVVDALAAEAPHWPPGTAHGYHTLSFGHLVGELVRRVDGRDLGTYVHDQLADPLGVDLFVGVPVAEQHRAADLALPPKRSALGKVARAALDIDPTKIERYDDPHILTPPVCNTALWRGAQIPGANGHANARALARVYGALANGGEGVLRPGTIDAVRTPQVTGPDRTIGCITQFGLGFNLPGGDVGYRRGSRGFGHGGAYGSLGWSDPEARLGFGFVFNQCGEPQADGRAARLLDAAFESIVSR